MTKPTPRAPTKRGFAPASFAKLLAIAGDDNDGALRIELDDIDEDPDQPRKVIDEAELAPLAATIRSHGVLQPVGVYPPVDGRYRLAFGARRLRASRIAEQTDIPAVIVPETQRNYASQIIENQQRRRLSNTDLAAAVLQLYSDDMPIEQIEVICNLKNYQVKAYRAVPKFPSFLKDRLDFSDTRALYDLYRQWIRTPENIEASMPEADIPISITEARRIISAISAISGKPVGSIVDKPPGSDETAVDVAAKPRTSVDVPALEKVHGARLPAEQAAQGDGDPALEKVHGALFPAKPSVADDDDPALEKVHGALFPAEHRAAGEGAPTITVAVKAGEHGQLILDQRPSDSEWAFVRYPTGIEEIQLSSLRIISIV